MRRVCASCFRKVVKGSDSIVPAVYAPPAVVPRLVYKHISEPEGVSEFASKHVVPEFALECVGVQRPDGSEEPECVSVPEFVLGRASSPDVVFELVPEPECVSDHACMLKLEVEHVSEPECVSERVSEPELVFGLAAAPKRLFEHVSEHCVVEHVSVSKLVYKHVSRPKGVSELASKLVVPKLVDKRVSRPMCVSDPVSELVVLNAVFERVSEPKCVSERAPTPKLVFEHVSEPECVSEHSPSLNHVFEHVSEPESVSDHVSLPKPVRERVSKPECVSQHVPAPKLAFEHASKPECVSVRASAPKLVFKHSYATELVFYHASVQGPCGSESAALVENVALFPECCEPKHVSEHAVAAPTVEASGSESAALPVSVVFKGTRQEYELPHAPVQGPCGSESAALFESVVLFPERCKPKHNPEHAVAARKVEACGSRSVAQVMFPSGCGLLSALLQCGVDGSWHAGVDLALARITAEQQARSCSPSGRGQRR